MGHRRDFWQNVGPLENGTANHSSVLPWEAHEQYKKTKRWHWNMRPLDQKVSNLLLGKKKGQLLITPERMKSFEPKWQNDLGSFPRQTIQHYINSSLCPKHWCQRSLSWPVLWKHTRPPRTNTFFFFKCAFHHRGLECESRKSRATWSSNQVWPWGTKWS